MQKNQNHQPLSPVCIGLASMFGTKCSCGHIHPSIMIGTKLEIDTDYRWCSTCNTLVGYGRLPNPFQCTCITMQPKRSLWGMVHF